ncbi:MAG: hypothetical protein H5T69_18440 [Chloroflexi bacterium]|nr:hypothetical protein [Chloroflexota bacterium]
MKKAAFTEIICTNTQPIPPEKRLPNMTVLSLGPWLARIIDAVHRGRSVGRTLREFSEQYEPEFA